MKVERSRRVEPVFQSALALRPADRSAYLSAECKGDEPLRREVLSLLDHYERASEFLERPAAALLEHRSWGPGDAVGTYRIIRWLGAGGMGEVYLAEDPRLGRKVALKFLPRSASHSAELVRRFQVEARAASALNHPNILTIYDVGLEAGQHFIASEFVDGTTLREELRRGPVSMDRAVDIAAQLASALEAAHAAGIVHRDIKPENVMVRPDGYVKVLDFGLAKLVEQLAGGGHSTPEGVRTKAGAVFGTVLYMSPEQTRGEVVDARTDLWSWGVVFYEMLVGKVPFIGSTPSHTAVQILKGDPPPFPAGRELSDRLQAIALKALRKDVAHRYQTASQIVQDLKATPPAPDTVVPVPPLAALRPHLAKRATLARLAGRWIRTLAARVSLPRALLQKLPAWSTARHRLLLAALLLLGIAIVTAGVLRPWPIERQRSGHVTIAVADFANETGEAALDGLSSMLITALEQSPRLSVLTRTRVLDILKQTANGDVSRIDERTAREGWRHIGASLLVLPSIRRFGRLYTIDLKVLDPQTNEYLVTARADGEEHKSIPDLIDRVSEHIRSELREQPEDIRGTRRKVGDSTTTNLAAYQAYFQGEELLNKLKFDEARTRFTDAIALDPQFGLAYYRLAYTNTWPVGYERHARGPLKKALELIERLPDKERHLVRALDAIIAKGFDAAVPILEHLAQRYPNDKELLFMLGDCHNHAGRLERGLAYFQQALRLDPTFLRALHHATYAYQGLQQYDKMRDLAARYAGLAPSEEAYRMVANSYMLANDLDGGIRELRALRERTPEFQSAVTPGLVDLLIRSGRDAEVAEEIASVKGWDTQGAYTQRLWIRTGFAYLHRGSPRAAERWFRKFVDTDQGAQDIEALTGLGRSLLGQNRYPDAERIFNRALAVLPENTGALDGLFSIKMQNKSYDAALAYAQRMRQVQPALPYAYTAEITAHLHAGRIEQADEVLRSGLVRLC